jgi:hypothetical protein
MGGARDGGENKLFFKILLSKLMCLTSDLFPQLLRFLVEQCCIFLHKSKHPLHRCIFFSYLPLAVQNVDEDNKLEVDRGHSKKECRRLF